MLPNLHLDKALLEMAPAIIAAVLVSISVVLMPSLYCRLTGKHSELPTQQAMLAGLLAGSLLTAFVLLYFAINTVQDIREQIEQIPLHVEARLFGDQV